MATLDSYLSGGQIPLGEEGERFRNLLRTVNTYNVNRAGGQALSLAGADIDPSGLTAQKRPGVLDVVFGALNAPRKALFRVAGVNPEVTGGDVFRTQKDDSILERAGKFAGAFAFDVVTDPLTYVGGTGLIGRKGAAELAASQAKRKAGFEAAQQALRNAGKDPDGLVETLYKNSPLRKLAGEEVATLGKAADDALSPSRQLLNRRAEIVQTGVSDAEALGVLRRELAEEEFGRIVGESLLYGGRKTTLDSLTNLLGDEKVAREVFSSLPSEVRGGALLRTATGKTLARIPGTGRGSLLGRPGERLNVARFNASERIGRTIAGVTGKTGISGEFGPSWQAVRSGLRKAMQDPNFDILKNNLGRDRLTTYTSFKQAHRNMSRARLTGLFKVWNMMGEANAAERDFVDQGLGDDYIRGRLLGYHAPEAGAIVDASEAEIAGMEMGRKLREAVSLGRLDQVEAGIPIADMGPGYQPLFLTEEGAKRRRVLDRVTTGKGGDVLYTPTAHRKEWIIAVNDPEQAKLLGYAIPDTNSVALSAVQINKILGQEDFITDPVQIASRYLEQSARSVAAQKFVNEALRAGVLVADVDYAASQARFDRLASFMSGVRKASPQLAKRVTAAKDKAERELLDAAGVATRDKTVQEASALRIKMNADYDAAVSGQQAVAQRLRDADAAVEQARPSRGVIGARLTGYAQTGVEDEVAQATRVAEAAQRRLRTKTAKYGESLDDLGEAQELRKIGEEGADELIDDAYTAAEWRFDDLTISQEAKDSAAAELARVRAIRNNVRQSVTVGELADLDAFEAALVRREAIRSEYEVARQARGRAAKSWTKYKDTPAVKSADEITKIARTLAGKHAAYRRAVADEMPKDIIEAAKKEADDASRLLRGAIGYKLPKGSPLYVYRDSLEKLAKNLGESEFDAARVLASEGKMVELLADMQDAYFSNDMERITSLADSIKETWFDIRERGIDFADLTDLNKAEKAILAVRTPSSLDLVKKTSRMSEFGEWLTNEDMVVLGRGIDSVPGTNIPARLEGLHASSGVRLVLENMYRAETTGAFKQFADKVTDPLLLMWKTGVTVGRGPAYVITNMIGGIYMSFIGGVSATNLIEGGGILVQLKKAYESAAEELPTASDPQRLFRAGEILEKKLAGKKIGNRPAYEVLKEFLEYNGYGGTQTADALELARRYGSAAPERALRFGQTVQRRGEDLESPLGRGYQRFIDAMMTNSYQRKMNNMAQSSELILRFGTYIDSIKKYDDAMFAMDRVNLLHFDYADLSDAEQTIRRLVPFYTWTRHNVPLQLRAMVMEPGKMKKWMYAQEEFRNAMEEDEESWYSQLLPEYLQDVGGFVSRLSSDAGPIAFGSRMPYDDVNRLFKVGGLNPLEFINYREAAKMVGPATTLPASLIGGVNLDTGAKFGPEGVEATGYEALLANTPILGGLLGASTGAKGESRIGEAQSYAVSELLPQLSIVNRLLSIPEATRPLATKSQQERALSNFLNLTGAAAITGQSATTLTPGSLTGEARRRIEKQDAIIDDAAGRMGISVEWLKDQIRAGSSNEEIADAIRRGEGERIAYETEKESRAKPFDRRYADMLDAMARGEVDLGY